MRRVTGQVAHYQWGSRDFLPDFLGVAPDGQPWAEFWLGTHPAHPSQVAGDRPLAEVAGDLPFLVKVLSAAEPLSIQTHPDGEQAEAGFAREEAAGVPLDSPTRNYRDRRGKPELLWAMTRVDAFCGFRDPDETSDLLRVLAVEGLAPMRQLLEEASSGRAQEVLAEALRWALLDAPDSAPGEVTAAAAAMGDEGPWRSESAWLARIGQRYPGDRGLLAALMLNLVRLEPGAALVLRPGVLHAYLSGAGVEVMGASDNVLRGGLTSKHVDVPELLAALRTGADWSVQQPRPDGPGLESLTAHEGVFSMRIARPGQSELAVAVRGATLALCVSGQVEVDGLPLTQGQAGYADVADVLRVSGPGSVVIVSSN